MARNGLERRQLLSSMAGASLGPLLSGRSFAQQSPIDLIERHILPEIEGKLPSGAIDVVRMIAALLGLEREASALGLPDSPLALDAAELPTSESEFYQAALPRLVALIDRGEMSDPGLGERAGGLLYELHSSQRVVPDALKGLTPTSTSREFDSLQAEYAAMFGRAAIRPEYASQVDWHVKAMRQFRPRYEQVGKELTAPWYFIGALHSLESSFNFRAHLHNGDFPLSVRTRQVPKGRPAVWLPPSDWESSAKDALRLLGFADQPDWSLERTLHRMEAYNGFGYRRRGVATPYLWSFSNHYDQGKFVRDGSWSAGARSQQCGAAVLIKALAGAGEISLTHAR